MNEPIFITAHDFKHLYRRVRSKMKAAAVVCGVAVLGFFALKEPQYTAEATFKQSSGKVEQNYDLKNFFRAFVAQETESAATSLMVSHRLLRPVVEQLGWQACVNLRAPSSLIDNIKLEVGMSISDPDSFSFRDVVYNGEKVRSFLLRFVDLDHYEILDDNVVHRGKIGERVEFEEVVLHLDKTPENLKIGKSYTLTLLPHRAVTSSIQSRLTIKPTKLDRSILHLKFTDRSRARATTLLNHVMAAYQTYLHGENQTIADAQLKYLEKRQEELNGKLDKTLEEHVTYLKQTMGERGFIGLHQEFEMLSAPQQSYTQKLFEIDFEIAHLERERYSPLTFAQNYLMERLDPISFEYQNLQVDRPEAAVEREKDSSSVNLQEATSLLDQLETDRELSSPRNPTLASLVARLKNAPDPATATEAKHRLTSHLRDFIQSIHLKEKILQEETLYAKSLESDFRGLDLESARALRMKYQTTLEQLHAELKQLLYLRDHIDDPTCEVGSLASIVPDAITQEMVAKASELEFQLQDALNRSEKEHARFREALTLQKQFIANHISHTIGMQKIRAELTKEKIDSLQKLILNLLATEKKLIEQRLQDLKDQMKDIPEKWRFEHLLKLKTDIAKGMMEGLTHLTESKVLNRHLYNVESRPIDKAFSPLLPNPPYLLLLSILGGLLGACSIYLGGVFKGLVAGFPTSQTTLKLLGEETSGELSSSCDAPFSELSINDLETLRHIASFLDERRVSKVVLLGEKNNDFSHNLASLLALRNKKSIILECDFDKVVSKDEVPGLWHYLSQESAALPIRMTPDFDFVPAGAVTRHGAELFTSTRFSSLLEELAPKYEVIFITNRASLGSAESLELAKHADAHVVTFVDESIETLSPYRHLPRQKEKQNVTFVHQLRL